MNAIKKFFLCSLVVMPPLGCSVKHQNEVSNGTFQIDPIAVPREIHVHTKDDQTIIHGEIEPLASDTTDAEGMLRLEVIGANNSVLETKEVCFAPRWEQQPGLRYNRTIYHSPSFKVLLSKVPPKESTFRFTVLSYGKACVEDSAGSNTPLIEVNGSK